MRTTLISSLFSSRAWAVALSVGLVAACGAPQRSGEELSESVRQFNDGVRWERFAIAATVIPPRDRSQFVDEMDQRATDLKITDYEIVQVDPKGERNARVHVKLTWYKASEGTVHETHAVQTWERHGKAWWMVEETRLRGVEMPGLAEPAERPAIEAPAPPTAMKD